MPKDTTDITVLLDRTGSMEPIRDDTIGGLNQFLEGQKAIPGNAVFSLIQFDSQDPFEVIHRARPIHQVPPLTAATYVPRAATPLLDAIGRTINDMGFRFNGMPESERPSKVILAIMTDGEENSSHEFTKDMIFDMISRQRDTYKWEIVFLGANQDAIQVGRTLGMQPQNTMTYAYTTAGARNAFRSLHTNTTAYRSGMVGTMAFTPEQRTEQEGELKWQKDKQESDKTPTPAETTSTS